MRKILTLPAAERWILLEACALLFFFSCALRVLPFRVVVRVAGMEDPRCGNGMMRRFRPARVATLVKGVGGVLRMSCLTRALALARMLASRGIQHELCIGVRRSGSALDAHAWVTASGDALIGAADPGAYVPLAQLQPRITADARGSARSSR
ncbi:MAG: lasso peptide biosynthesis B2 protein [Vicinamibacterales bacterium]